jgi:CTP:molybdopterin cytidylyltransferase MocA
MGAATVSRSRTRDRSGIGRVERAVVLAAGGSRRMGQPKALLVLAGRTVLAHHLERLAPWADDLVVVVGAAARDVSDAVPAGVRIRENPRWAETHPLDSAAIGLEDAQRALVLPVDVLPIAPTTLEVLVAADGDAVPVGPDGRDGHPVLLGAPTLDAIRGGARPEGGLRTLLRGARRVAVPDALVSVDFDDPAAFAAAREAWETGRIR